MRAGGAGGPRPAEAAGGHAERVQDLGPQVVGERLAGELLDQQLEHAVATARVQPAPPGLLQQLDQEAVAGLRLTKAAIDATGRSAGWPT